MALGKTVAELLDSISAREFRYWVGFARIEPFGFPSTDRHSALLRQAIVHSTGPGEFIPLDRFLYDSESVVSATEDKSLFDDADTTEADDEALFMQAKRMFGCANPPAKSKADTPEND